MSLAGRMGSGPIGPAVRSSERGYRGGRTETTALADGVGRGGEPVRRDVLIGTTADEVLAHYSANPLMQILRPMLWLRRSVTTQRYPVFACAGREQQHWTCWQTWPQRKHITGRLCTSLTPLQPAAASLTSTSLIGHRPHRNSGRATISSCHPCSPLSFRRAHRNSLRSGGTWLQRSAVSRSCHGATRRPDTAPVPALA